VQARLLLRFYNTLYKRQQGEGVAMLHWLWVELQTLGGTPHRLVVDEGRLVDVAARLMREG